MLSEQQRTEFDLFGVVKVNSLLSEQAGSRARNAVLSRFEGLGLACDDEWQLAGRSRTQWPDKGYSAKAIGNKIVEVERLLDEPNIKPIANTILENAELDRQVFKRPQILVTLPNAGNWFVPDNGWHVDLARLKSGRCPGVQLFVLLSEIKPKGGGTLVMAGSHKLLNNGSFIRASEVAKQIKQDPAFVALMTKSQAVYDDGGQTQRIELSAKENGLAIVELIGSPGDAYFMDLRVLHSAAPNVSDSPRMMATHRFLRADVVPELTIGK